MDLKNYEDNPSQIVSEYEEMQIKLVKATLCFSFFVVLFLLTLLHQYVTQDHVPVFIFLGSSFSFQAFVISIAFSLTSAFNVFLIRNQPRLAALRRYYFMISVIFMALASSILFYALAFNRFVFDPLRSSSRGRMTKTSSFFNI